MHQTRKDFLVEIGTEELPPKSLHQLASSFSDQLEQALIKAEIQYDQVQSFATPRRMGLLITNLAEQQPQRVSERIGPSVAHAYDPEGNPTAAALGFAKSCQVPLSSLVVKETAKGQCLCFNQVLEGENIFKLAPGFVQRALQQLPIPKPMYWGNHSEPFIRPVHWLLMLYGNEVIPCELFDLTSGNKTYGHRFLHPMALDVATPKDYQPLLETKAYVLADYDQRKAKIRDEIHNVARTKGQAIIDEALLDEVTSLVEWPVALLGTFDERFLQVPPEALISAMKVHQKSFPIVNQNNQLQPYFITIANIESKAPEQVVIGNERVMRARLWDAEFFYHTDLKHGIDHYLENLNTVIFQQKLGTLYEKAERIANLAAFISSKLDGNPEPARRAGLLAKADLMTDMVGEFPELQGIMGYYYALKDNEPVDIAVAIKEHYYPRFSGDQLPHTALGSAVALADRIDTLIGIFGIHQAPTGEKDPFGLRRAAMSVLRILIENQLPLDLKELLSKAKEQYSQLGNGGVIAETLDFTLERLRAWYLEKGITSDVYAAVVAKNPTAPLDFDHRIKAVQAFVKFPEASALAAANKRVSNILKQAQLAPHQQLNYGLLQEPAEQALAKQLEKVGKQTEELCAQANYTQALALLAQLRQSVDHFFDQVMVMVEDEKLRTNRLILLTRLREMFLQIADISLLQS